MELAELIDGLAAELRGDPATPILDLTHDSRRAGPGTAFVCVPGMTSDGHDHAPGAVEAGAAALVVERPLELGVPEVEVADARAAMAPLARRMWGDPSATLDVLGVTGTNGKTTTTYLVREICERAGVQTGLLGTISQIVGGESEPVERTTPEAIDLQRTLARMRDAGDRACAIEISSHALVLGRADALHVRAAGFTNLTQDHLDFHSDMDDYFSAKALLFDPPEGVRGPPAVSVINVDDPYGRKLAERAAARGSRVLRCSTQGNEADLVAAGLEIDASGCRFTLEAGSGSHAVTLPLPGRFNAENALIAIGLCSGAGIGYSDAATALAEVPPVPGRMEPIVEGQEFGVLVDYAHTPDSVENVLVAARGLTGGRLIAIVGCGGDRDRSKRPLMGSAAERLADLAVITSDNPRSEEPEAIIADVLEGIEDREAAVIEVDRRRAIREAFARATPGDLVVIAGKGHEQGQEFADGHKIPFDDRDVAREELAAIGVNQ